MENWFQQEQPATIITMKKDIPAEMVDTPVEKKDIPAATAVAAAVVPTVP